MSDEKSQPHKNKIPPKTSMALEPLRFGIDIDGTISQAPRHFKRLIDALLERGNEVYIVTGRFEDTRRMTKDLLDSLSIRYTQVIMRPVDWPSTVPDYKVQVMQEKDIHLMIDDDDEICWAIQTQTKTLAAHMLPIPETSEAHAVKARLHRKERQRSYRAAKREGR
ncbi:MAG: hypothetical protein HYY30_03605 [Chloroflexi bacterium]|nr:hypothetical protein [Chloroflexota bacterium]